MVVPAYTEISHFRAPYKNWPHLGVGPSVATMSGFGQPPTIVYPPGVLHGDGFGQAIPASITGAPGQMAQALSPFTTDANGVRVFQPAVADAVITMLQGFSVIFLTNDAVKIEPAVPGDVREKASAWVKRKLAEGKSVVAGSPAGVQAFVTPVAVDRTLEAVKGVSGEKDKAGAGTLALTAVLARPAAGLAKAGMMGPIGIAVLALALIGGATYFLTRKRRARSNPAKRNRRRRRVNRRRRHR